MVAVTMTCRTPRRVHLQYHMTTEPDVRTYLLCVRMNVLSYETRNLKMNPEEVQGSIKPTIAMDVQRRASSEKVIWCPNS